MHSGCILQPAYFVFHVATGTQGTNWLYERVQCPKGSWTWPVQKLSSNKILQSPGLHDCESKVNASKVSDASQKT